MGSNSDQTLMFADKVTDTLENCRFRQRKKNRAEGTVKGKTAKFAPQIPVVLVISVVSVICATPATDPLLCGSMSCLRHFRGSRRFRKKNRIAKHRFSET